MMTFDTALKNFVFMGLVIVMTHILVKGAIEDRKYGHEAFDNRTTYATSVRKQRHDELLKFVMSDDNSRKSAKERLASFVNQGDGENTSLDNNNDNNNSNDDMAFLNRTQTHTKEAYTGSSISAFNDFDDFSGSFFSSVNFSS